MLSAASSLVRRRTSLSVVVVERLHSRLPAVSLLLRRKLQACCQSERPHLWRRPPSLIPWVSSYHLASLHCLLRSLPAWLIQSCSRPLRSPRTFDPWRRLHPRSCPLSAPWLQALVLLQLRLARLAGPGASDGNCFWRRCAHLLHFCSCIYQLFFGDMMVPLSGCTSWARNRKERSCHKTRPTGRSFLFHLTSSYLPHTGCEAERSTPV